MIITVFTKFLERICHGKVDRTAKSVLEFSDSITQFLHPHSSFPTYLLCLIRHLTSGFVVMFLFMVKKKYISHDIN